MDHQHEFCPHAAARRADAPGRLEASAIALLAHVVETTPFDSGHGKITLFLLLQTRPWGAGVSRIAPLLRGHQITYVTRADFTNRATSLLAHTGTVQYRHRQSANAITLFPSTARPTGVRLSNWTWRLVATGMPARCQQHLVRFAGPITCRRSPALRRRLSAACRPAAWPAWARRPRRARRSAQRHPPPCPATSCRAVTRQALPVA